MAQGVKAAVVVRRKEESDCDIRAATLEVKGLDSEVTTFSEMQPYALSGNPVPGGLVHPKKCPCWNLHS